MKKLAVALGLLLTTSCTHIDTGQVDYRVADGPETADRSRADTSRCDADSEQRCDPLVPVRVDRRYMPDTSDYGRPFAQREVYAIDIDQGMIGTNLLEGEILGHQFGRVGEFAILANVFEFASSESETAQRRFLESGEYSSNGEDPSDVELKLIFYSDDVRRSQPFSFSHVPIRARTVYNGNAIGIQIVIIETDVRSGPMGSLLTTLARFGQQAIPGPSETTDLLFDLGESLFSGTSGSDDRLFEYRFVLSAPTTDRTSFQPTFAPGRYVLRRAQDRVTPINWNNVRLDHNTGRLFRYANRTYGTEVRDELYLVLNVTRWPEGTAPEYYSSQGWPEFRRLLQSAADTEDAPLGQLTREVQAAIATRRSEQWRAELLAQWSAIERLLRIHSVATILNLRELEATLSSCPAAKTEIIRTQQTSERAVRDAVRRLIADYIAATRKSGDPSVSEMSDADRDVFISRVVRYFMPWSPPENEQKFTDATAFANAFAGNDPRELGTMGIATARSQGRRATGCADLLSGVPRI